MRVDGLVQNPTTGAWEPNELHPQDLVGLHWAEEICVEGNTCVSVTYRIASVEMDLSQSTMVNYPDNSDVWLYEIEYTDVANPTEGRLAQHLRTGQRPDVPGDICQWAVERRRIDDRDRLHVLLHPRRRRQVRARLGLQAVEEPDQ